VACESRHAPLSPILTCFRCEIQLCRSSTAFGHGHSATSFPRPACTGCSCKQGRARNSQRPLGCTMSRRLVLPPARTLTRLQRFAVYSALGFAGFSKLGLKHRGYREFFVRAFTQIAVWGRALHSGPTRQIQAGFSHANRSPHPTAGRFATFSRIGEKLIHRTRFSFASAPLSYRRAKALFSAAPDLEYPARIHGSIAQHQYFRRRKHDGCAVT